jgi:hypothetical protein
VTPPRVIPSGASTARSGVLAESKDLYSLFRFHNRIQTKCPILHALCEGWDSANAASLGKARYSIPARFLRRSGIPQTYAPLWFDLALNLPGASI